MICSFFSEKHIKDIYYYMINFILVIIEILSNLRRRLTQEFSYMQNR